MHYAWLEDQKFLDASQHIVFQDCINTIKSLNLRVDAFDRQIEKVALESVFKDYDKGQSGYWVSTKPNLSLALERAKIRKNHSTAYEGVEPYKDMDRLVQKLMELNPRNSA